jgi:hypothetical protein
MIEDIPHVTLIVVTQRAIAGQQVAGQRIVPGPYKGIPDSARIFAGD